MPVKKALLAGFTIAAILLLATPVIGHLWVFIIIVTTVLIGIAMSLTSEDKKMGSDDIDDEQL